MNNNNKTLKQLLTEPYRVQKKNGYYSYDHFKSKARNLCSILSGIVGVNILLLPYEEAIDVLISLIDKILAQPEEEHIFHENQCLIASITRLQWFIRSEFLKEQNIAYVDKDLLDSFAEIKVSGKWIIDRCSFRSLFLILPKNISAPLMALHIQQIWNH